MEMHFECSGTLVEIERQVLGLERKGQRGDIDVWGRRGSGGDLLVGGVREREWTDCVVEGGGGRERRRHLDGLCVVVECTPACLPASAAVLLAVGLFHGKSGHQSQASGPALQPGMAGLYRIPLSVCLS